jgi:hypothetical protein
MRKKLEKDVELETMPPNTSWSKISRDDNECIGLSSIYGILQGAKILYLYSISSVLHGQNIFM